MCARKRDYALVVWLQLWCKTQRCALFAIFKKSLILVRRTQFDTKKARVRARAVREPPLQRVDSSRFPFSTASLLSWVRFFDAETNIIHHNLSSPSSCTDLDGFLYGAIPDSPSARIPRPPRRRNLRLLRCVAFFGRLSCRNPNPPRALGGQRRTHHVVVRSWGTPL